MTYPTAFRLLCALALAALPTVAAPQGTAPASAASDGAALAKQLSNPIASLISVPLQFNYDDDYGDGSGEKRFVNIQPVIPISISPTWNLISRTIIPLVDQDDLAPGSGSQTGLGNVTQSLFFSPKEPTAGGLIWGVGPVLQLPTATDDIARDQWAAGLTGVALVQSGPLDRRRAGEPCLVDQRRRQVWPSVGQLPAALPVPHDPHGHVLHAEHRKRL